jgi:hypothetical protein
MKGLSIAFCISALVVFAQRDPCAGLESGVESEVRRLPMAKDEIGVFRAIGDRALDALGQCPQSSRLWYLATRSAEVLESRSNGQAFAASGGLKKIVADALSHAPSSAAVVTVAARVEGSSTLARKALALDPRYQPARRALAETLAREGAVEEALRVATVDDRRGPMHLTRARVLLAAKRPGDAVQEAKKITPSEPDELSPAADMHRDEQEVLGFALLELNRPAEAMKALRAAASAGSVAAQKQLGK